MAWGAWICLLAPLAGCVLILLGGTRIPRRAAGVIGTLSVFVGFAGAIVTFVDMVSKDEAERSEITTAWTWLQAGDFSVGLQLLVDPLSAFMMLIVSGVGGLIVWYSIGYMDGDDEERRYFAYMALFVFSMLLLVEGGNLLLLLAGWGLVGLASYLLIGFWHQRPEAVAAAKKAFVMNAFGDATMALAFFLLIQQTGTLSFAPVFEAAESGELSNTVVTLVALGLLGGAVAKSAQIPLHTWLPDAMEGPTPVSALIHAATMVTAGVYLIARTAPVFEASDGILELAGILGAITLLVAGLVALVQTDIKRVIAYSTMSQIGYMFVGVGVGAFSAGMFHLLTHAFFKALLFLAAGLVIHQLGGEQDIRRMGGLKGVMPRTAIAFLIGSLALVGIFPLAGFWSKDPILASAWAYGGYGYALFAAGLVGAFFTGIYAFRLYFIVFGGERSAFVEEHAGAHGQGEGPRSMAIPVAILTAGTSWSASCRCRGMGGRLRLPEPGRRAARRAVDGGGLDDERRRRRRRRRRDRHRLGAVRRAHPRGAKAGVPAAGARAQALVRRALRRALLPTSRPGRRLPAPLVRGAGHPGLDHGGHDRHPRGGHRRGRGADRLPAQLRPRDRGLGRRSRRRLRGGAMRMP